ncbi:MAG: DUF5457 domain-containing protein [Flavobacteriaceae bacterium]|nr:DUF5457 domain-containing protein [Flavobacteriaceae bacterium]
MKATKTDALLHDVVLEIMFNENYEKAVPLSIEDILWKIDNPEISERNIREVLDWLVRQRRMGVHFGKYTMNRYEFLDQKEKKEANNSNDTDNKTPKKILKKQPKKVIKETFRLNRPEKEIEIKIKKGIPLLKIVFFLGVIGLLFMSYNYWKEQESGVFNEDEKVQSSVQVPEIKFRQMYLSLKSESTEELFRDVSNSFSRERANNNKLDKKITALFQITDSIQQVNARLILELQKSINHTVTNSNKTYQRLLICNLIFLVLIVIAYVKRK